LTLQKIHQAGLEQKRENARDAWSKRKDKMSVSFVLRVVRTTATATTLMVGTALKAMCRRSSVQRDTAVDCR